VSFLHVETVKTTDHTSRMGANEVTCNTCTVKSVCFEIKERLVEDCTMLRSARLAELFELLKINASAA
jgi:hypothetical protein